MGNLARALPQKGKQMEEIKGNIFEVLKGCIDQFCKECCAGPMIYDDDLKSLQRWCDEKCPFLRQFQMIKGEENDRKRNNCHEA